MSEFFNAKAAKAAIEVIEEAAAGVPLTHESIILQLAASMQAASERMTLLVEALRDVQYLHSRALIELPPRLEREIIDLIGPHPRDGEES